MKNATTQKRSRRIRTKLKKVNNDRFRLTVFRSARNISAQIIDDKSKKTLVSASSLKDMKNTKKKIDLSLHIADVLLKKALEKKITKVYFDRGSYKYHGRIKVFADALRKGGLTF